MDKNKSKILCEFCEKEIETIPISVCNGQLVCYEHLETDSTSIYCFFCDEHRIEVKQCLELPKNKHQIKKYELETSLNELNRDVQDLKLFINDPIYFLNQTFDDLKRKVDLKREELKQELFEKIDIYYEELMLQIRLKYEEREKCLKEDLNSINFESIENKINSILTFNDKIDKTRNIDNKINKIEKQIDQIKLLFENIKSFKSNKDEMKFYRLENSILEHEIDIENLFGFLNFKPKFSDKFKGKSTIICDGHTDSINGMKILKTGEILTCSDDNTMKLWDMNSGNCLKTFSDHSHSVLCIEILKSGEIITGSCDETIKIWNKDTDKCIQTFKGHEDSVCCLLALEKNDDEFVSGSDDSTIILWNKTNPYLAKEFFGHSWGVTFLNLLSTGELVSSSYDKTIKIWNLENECCIRTLNFDDGIECFKFLNQNQVVVSMSSTLKLINFENGKCLKTYDEHCEFIWSYELIDNNEMISCSEDETIKIWNLLTGECVKTIELDDYDVKCLKLLENGSLLTGDSALKIWK